MGKSRIDPARQDPEGKKKQQSCPEGDAWQSGQQGENEGDNGSCQPGPGAFHMFVMLFISFFFHQVQSNPTFD